ncbi:MAG: phosphomannomutase/phosphoglucomutase [Pseudomonadota bacterium]
MAKDQPATTADGTAAAGTPASKGARKARTGGTNEIWLYALVAIAIALAGVLAAFGVVGWQLVAGTESAIAEREDRQNATAIAGLINAQVANLRQQLESTGRSELAATAATALERAERESRSAQLEALLPFAKRVDVIPRGLAEVDLNADVPITFAALDVIKRAESEPFVGPEASLSQRQTLYAAAPVTKDGIVVGVLFAAVRYDYLLNTLNLTFGQERGLVSLIQQFEGTAASPVLQWGAGNSEATPVMQQLLVPHWRLEYQPPGQGFALEGGWQNLLMPLGLAVGLTLGGIALAFSGLTKRLQNDAALLRDYAGKLVRRGGAQPQRYQLGLFAEIAADLRAQAGGGADDGDGVGDGVSETPKRSLRSRRPANGNAAEPAAPTTTDVVADLLAEDDDPLYVSDRQGTDNFGIEVSEEPPEDQPSAAVQLDPDIFRAYDIRGIVNQNLSEDVVYWIGRAFAAEAAEENVSRTVVARDGRLSSPALAKALAQGLTDGGLDVTDIGQVPTPMLYFATHSLNTGTGIMVTGSHNPPDYNGLKMVLGGETLAEARILRLHQRIERNELTSGQGSIEAVDLISAYLDRIIGDVALAQPLKVVVDCGNGVAGGVVPELLTELGCEVVPLYCEVDGTFPNHHPDPADPATLEDLKTVVEAEQADLGLAFDGDGDRLGVVTPAGTIIWPDKLMMLFSQDIVSRNPGADIIYDVKCSRHLNTLISEYGGRPIMWRTGHSHIKAKMKETGALLGGEFSGHICFGERWYGFDDALYSAARLLEIIAAEAQDADELFAQFPVTHATPELKIQTTDKDKFSIMSRLTDKADFGDGTLTTIDGLRVDYPDGWGLIRPSNTSPVLSLRFEADTPEALERIQSVFSAQLKAVNPALSIG